MTTRTRSKIRASEPHRGGLPAIRFELLTTNERFDAIEGAWRALEARSSTALQFFQSWLWNRIWWRHFEREYRLRIVAGYVGETLVLLWPLVERRRAMCRVLEPTGGLLSCYGDALVDTGGEREAWIDAAWSFLEQQRGVCGISMPAVHEGGNVADVVARRAGHPIATDAAPTISLESLESFDGLLGRLSKGMRKEIRRARRGLEAMGRLEHLVNDEQLTPEKAASTVVRFKRDWIKHHGLPSRTVTSSDGEAFLAEYCRQVGEDSGSAALRVSALRLDDKLVAAGIAFVYRGQQLEYLGGFDHAMREHGVGKTQLAASIEHAIRSGDDSCGLLTPETDFKLRWTEDRPLVRQYFHPLSFRGRIYRRLYLRNVRPLLKQLYQTTRPRLRRRGR